ncbi:SRPBCC family protein [Noviherbaspirillum saxi]|uniref:Polyketide cyclase n=1 Tax=Noviherbaspirillum saxi TaxID=2320863 RepID=A0A3A3G372_9BURK|nr:SRPBCC family protein [Noviherbaspirillum saxi]RJF95856.1 polyketide cyclase [Noviherbaspirillum saxi]
MIKLIALSAIAVVAGVTVVLIAAATRPDIFRVERSTSIHAPAERILPLLTDLRRFNSWSPYAKKDPSMKGEYRGPASGAGAAYHFEGNKDVGKGSIEIVDASAADKLTMKLDMIEPFEGHNIVEFRLAPQEDGTRVTWSMHGPSPLIARVVGLFMNMDSMIGRDFETGLGNLKAMAERT